MESKDYLRREYLERRAALTVAAREEETQNISRLFFEKIPLASDAAVSGYWPVRGEVDVRPILRCLKQQGHAVALPRIGDGGLGEGPLAFSPWDETAPLLIGPMSIPEPSPGRGGDVTPDVLLVPLLAFDRRGHRLGYGKGMYDRTLRLLRAARAVTAVGVAFAAQECDDLPVWPGDEKLDWILTGREALYFGERKT